MISRRHCLRSQSFKRYAEITSEPTEFNLYGETGLLYVWLRLITRERDYNLYCHFYQKDGGAKVE